MNDKMNGPFGHVGNAIVVGDITNCWKTSNTMLPEDYRINNENGPILFRTLMTFSFSTDIWKKKNNETYSNLICINNPIMSYRL